MAHQVADWVAVLCQGRIAETGEVRAEFAARVQEYTLIDAVPVPDPSTAPWGRDESGAGALLSIGA
ncbi:hypothetical protein ACTWPB_14025 [Nocardia sp. IBHARD005]|uniref:hypothetical protein n=1 Tax=Nocardia sp. IBHARD005 TaxID=3457765 RepID=UPI004057DA06